MLTAEEGGISRDARTYDPAVLLMASDVLVPVDRNVATHALRIGSLERAVHRARARGRRDDACLARAD